MSNTSAAAIKTVGVTREYKRGKLTVPALNGVDLTVQRGEVLGIVGPSGSGKTTLLNLIGGLDRPTSGSMTVDGVELGRLNGRELADYRLRKVGFIFQFYNLIPTLTALENVELPLSLANTPQNERSERASQLLKKVGLEGRMGHRPDELSGGEQQRVAVARALANAPSVILGDEPTGDLDSRSSSSLMDLLVSLKAERQTTFVLVTHDPIVAARCDRIYSMRDGAIVRETTRADRSLAESGGSERIPMDGLY